MPVTTPPPIFISYRRSEGGGTGHANSLRQGLEGHFGKGKVFQDNFSIKSGSEWEAIIPEAIQQARIILVFIHGDEWFTCTEPISKYEVRRRLFLENDWVRKEIRLALMREKDLTILPVVISQKVSLWPKDETERKDAGPEDIQAIFKLNYESFDPDQLEDSLDRLVRRMAEVLPPEIVGQEDEPADLGLLVDLPLDPKLIQGLCHVEAPYLGLAYFERQHAPLFFGREKEIREVYEEKILALPPGQVLLLYGASGVGKSSLLHAGLFPRMEYQAWYVGYRRRKSKQVGLDGDLKHLIEEAKEQEKEAQLLLLDQIEEMITDPGKPGEIQRFFDLLKEIVSEYPALKVTLCFRKEYLADVKDQLKDREILFRWFSLRPLEKNGIRRAIKGAVVHPDIREQFEGFEQIEPELVDDLVRDISRDEASHIAPLLQYQLRTLWDRAVAQRTGGPIRLTQSLYEGEKTLKEFLEKHKLKDLEKIFPEQFRTGLINDILYYYTTPYLTAASRVDVEYFNRYAHTPAEILKSIQDQLVNAYLLIRNSPHGSHRLAHDALARIVQERFQASEAPGQRASHIVQAKRVAHGGRAEAMDFSPTDIQLIQAGRKGMHCIPEDIEEKIQVDLARYQLQQKQRFELAFSQAQADRAHLRFVEAMKNLHIASQEGIEIEAIWEEAQKLIFPFQQLSLNEKVAECEAFLDTLVSEFPGVVAGPEGGADKDSLGDHARPNLPDQRPCFFPTLRGIPSGSFLMGSEEGYAYEKPLHEVQVDAFQMADTPVTCWQYGLFCLSTGRDLPGDSGFGRGDLPVINVSWYDALEYCNWLSKQENLEPAYEIEGRDVNTHWEHSGYRLPTEAEWEYAARAGGRNFRFGNGKNLADPNEMNFDSGHEYNSRNLSFVNEEKVPSRKGRGRTTGVKSFSPNAFGLYDMSGNVLEWCWDKLEKSYYQACKESRGKSLNPRGPSGSQDSSKVVRGGSWFSYALNCRCSYRNSHHPLVRDDNMGFRVVRR